MTMVVHVDIFAVAKRERCDLLGRDLNQLVPVETLGELRWYLGYFYARDCKKGVLMVSQQTFAEQLANGYRVEYGRSVSMPVATRLAVFGQDEAPGNWSFRELVGSLTWLSTQTLPDISNAVRAVARYFAAPKLSRWKATLGILRHVRRTSSFGITFVMEMLVSVHVLVNAQ